MRSWSGAAAVAMWGAFAVCGVAYSQDADCDNDGISDADAIAAGAADVNGNGVPDTCECLLDLTGNGEVDGADLAVILSSWGEVSKPLPPADVNRDGLVNGFDLGVLLSSWGPCDAVDAGYEVVGFWNISGDPFSNSNAGAGFVQVAVVDQAMYPDSDIGVPTTTGGVTSFENPVDLLTWTNPLSSNAYRYLAYRWLGAVGDEPDPAWDLSLQVLFFGTWFPADPEADLGTRTFVPVGQSTPVTYRIWRMDEVSLTPGDSTNLPERIF